jgi:hypothetical protein
VTSPLRKAKAGSGAAASGKKRASGSPRLPEGATKADLPPALQPQLATLVDGPPNDPSDKKAASITREKPVHAGPGETRPLEWRRFNFSIPLAFLIKRLRAGMLKKVFSGVDQLL